MKKVSNLLRYVPKRFAIGIALALATVVPVMVFAWGPSRPTFTIEHPAPYVTFNSITNNPAHGDERNFVQVKAAEAPNSAYGESVTLQPGKQYDVFIYYHNNAASNLNASGKGIAQGAFVKAQLPAVVNGSANLVGHVGASNAKPTQVWDEAAFKSSGAYAIRFVPGSATIHNKGATNGAKLADKIVTTGVPLGYDQLNGKVPGCEQFAGYVTFRVQADQPNFNVAKEVRKLGGDKTWQENVAVKPNDKVEYRIKYTNTGTTVQNNVVVKDILPEGMNYVNGTTKLYTTIDPNGSSISDNVTKNGVNIGSYQPNSTAYVMFQAQAVSNDKLKVCGNNTLRNVARVETNNGSREDDANVTVPKECQPAEAKYVCTGLAVSQISRTQFNFKASSTIQNANFVKYVYVVRDSSNNEIDRIDGTENQAVSYTQAKVGKYTVQASLVVRVDGQEKTVTSDACKKPFEVKEQPPKNEYACESLTLVKKSRDTFEFTVKPMTAGNVTVKEYNFVFGDGESLIVGAGTQTVPHTYKDADDYPATVSISFNVDGKTVTDVTSEKCKVKVTVEKVPPAECKPGIPVNDRRCEEAPTANPKAPKELPSTGPESLIGGLLGTSALGMGVHSWLNSRRALRSAGLNNKR